MHLWCVPGDLHDRVEDLGEIVVDIRLARHRLGIAVARHVERDHPEPPGQRIDIHHPVLPVAGAAMQQHQRLARPETAPRDTPAGLLERRFLESPVSHDPVQGSVPALLVVPDLDGHWQAGKIGVGERPVGLKAQGFHDQRQLPRVLA